MKHKFTLIVTLIVTFSITAHCQNTYVDNGTSATYTLQNGDSLYISKGSFTGTVNDWYQGGKVTVAAGATFKPLNVSGFRSKYIINGTAILSSLQTEGGFDLKNYGTITVNGNAQMNGAPQTWTNFAGATISFTGSVSLNVDGGKVINQGEITAGGDFNIYSNSAVTNKKTLAITGSFNSSNGQINNEGYFLSKKAITIGGNTAFTNTCRMIAEKGITINNNSATIYNNGLVWASNNQNSSVITNSGTIISTGNGIIKSVSFTNYGTLRGAGLLYLTGKTINSGTVGISGSTTDTLKIYTVNRTKTTQIFDDQWGTVNGNAIFSVFQAPDTVSSVSYSCAAESASSVILPVQWNNFSVKLSNNIPVLNWSAIYDGITFEIQRSFDGILFNGINTMQVQQNVTTYEYNDQRLPATHPDIVYYRIKVVEVSGMEKYSEIKAVRLTNTASIQVQTVPNPFTSQLNINYQATKKGMVTITIFNLDGRLQTTKIVQVNNGYNSISLTEVAAWKSGIYILKLSTENGIYNSTKLIKQ